MGLNSILKRIAKAVPVIVANAPAVADAVRVVAKALRKPKKQPAPPEAGATPAQ
jgi:hypothetical protein